MSFTEFKCFTAVSNVSNRADKSVEPPALHEHMYVHAALFNSGERERERAKESEPASKLTKPCCVLRCSDKYVTAFWHLRYLPDIPLISPPYLLYIWGRV